MNNTTKEQHASPSDSEIEESTVNVREIINKYIFHWPVFVLGITICLIAAFFYLRYTVEVYAVNSTLLIKDQKKGGGVAGDDLLNELNLFGSSKVVDNEIEILKSKTLMRKVVNRLNLMIGYSVEGRVIQSDIYETKPVEIGVIEIDSAWYGRTLNLSFPSATTYVIEDPLNRVKMSGLLDSLQRNKFGVFKITRNPNFNKWRKLNKNLINLSIRNPLSVADQYLGDLTVTLASKQSTVLSLKLQTTVPQRGKDVLNTLVQVYNEAALADKNKTTQSTMEFIDVRLKLISGELTDVEKDVEGFKSTRGITNMSNDATLFLDNVKANDVRLNEVNLKLSVIQDIQRYVNSTSSEEKLPSTLGIEDPVLLGQITQLSELQAQRDKLFATVGANHPNIAIINKQIESARDGIKSNVDNIFLSLNNTKKALQGNESQNPKLY
ncbi:GumC family protein [Pedobacter sp. UC225_65]|uniref:GumC family protein n=1 Tax=Pedobacter sp. UC225_65 TaxID=3350173 RepID=UPI003671058B